MKRSVYLHRKLKIPFIIYKTDYNNIVIIVISHNCPAAGYVLNFIIIYYVVDNFVSMRSRPLRETVLGSCGKNSCFV